MKRYLLTLLLALLFLFAAAPQANAAKTTYLIAVDGLSYESFRLAQSKGLFQEFKFSGAHIAPFPSMTDLSWSMIVKTTDLFGNAGRIGSVEAVHFNESQKAVEGDVRDVYRRMAQPKLYLNAFEYLFNPYVEALMYFPTKELFRVEAETVLKGMQGATPKSNLVTGYIGGVDSTAHTQIDRLYPVLENLSEQLSVFLKDRQSQGHEVEIVLVSDHGNVGYFQEGQKEVELQKVEMDAILKSIGLNSTQKLTKANDVAMPLMALGSWAPVYVKDARNIPRMLTALSQYHWFDFGVQIEERSENRTILLVTGASGQAKVHFTKKSKTYFYEVLKGNPLQLPSDLHSSGGNWRGLTEDQIKMQTRTGNYPDSLIRLIESTQNDQFDFPDVILTLKDGFYINNSLGKMTKMVRTHGSLSRKSSLGLVASTSRQVPSYLRSGQILPFLGIKAESLFGKVADKARKPVAQAIDDGKNQKAIPTGHKDFSQKRIFQQMTKVIANSRPFFVLDEITDFMSAFKVTQDSNNLPKQIVSIDLDKMDSKPILEPQEIGELTDLALTTTDFSQLPNHPKILALQKKFGLESSKDESLDSTLESHKSKSLGIKRGIMKMYQIPFLLDQSLVLQEKPQIPDERDFDFASYWSKNASTLNSKLSPLNIKPANALNWIPWKRSAATPTVPERLFQEVFKEKVLEDRIFPEPMDSFYRQSPSNTTVVYVPGTYNGIFDREIFSLGLLSLKEELGLRVLKAPVLSACNSDYNGELLLNFLKEDQKKYLSRKEAPPRYLLLGYSKGGVDSLYSLVRDTEFAKKSILGLVAIASPLRGSEVLEKTDLPFRFVNMLIEENTPSVCVKDKNIASTQSVAALNRFWRQNESKLIGLTRYFSVAFVSKPEDSHLYMKITKAIGQFEEDNDGIVGLSSSKFPSRLSAVDLGVVEADHLAGILASRFPQKAFMRSIVTTLAELGLENDQISENWKLRSILQSAPVKVEGKYNHQVNPYSKTVMLREYNNNANIVSRKELTYQDAYDLNKILIGEPKDPASKYETKTQLTKNQLNFDPYSALDVTKLTDTLSAKSVSPVLADSKKEGIDLSYNHSNFIFYRMDHQFSYENRSPIGGDNNSKWGFESAEGPDKSPWLALRSLNNSIRLTTLSYRFKVVDYNLMDLTLKVTQGPQGADPVKGKSGKDDSAFQVWFTLRDLRGASDRSIVGKETQKVYFFGYYWGEEVPNENRQAGQLFENYYSNKNVIVTTLPESYQVVLNTGKEDLGKVVNYKKNMAEDIKKAFPKLDVNQLEVVAITFQMDSNDTGTKSEAFMKTLRFLPGQKEDFKKQLAQKY